jgi:chemotaxis response regulator CheB
MLHQSIVAIGGSAGSLEVLKRFFDNTPLNNASYVILRHVPAGYKSSLNYLLQMHSKLQVQEAKDKALLLPNTVYFAPPHFHMSISKGCFRLIKRIEGELNRTIDIFLKSLAKNGNSNSSIAVILSGTGTDGVKGAEAFKKAGGLVITQEPGSCVFPFLPEQIIKKGFADFVLLPEDMPAVIHGYATNVCKA